MCSKGKLMKEERRRLELASSYITFVGNSRKIGTLERVFYSHKMKRLAQQKGHVIQWDSYGVYLLNPKDLEEYYFYFGKDGYLGLSKL